MVPNPLIGGPVPPPSLPPPLAPPPMVCTDYSDTATQTLQGIFYMLFSSEKLSQLNRRPIKTPNKGGPQ